MTRAPVLIFDFGNVVAHFDYRKACERYGRHVGLSGEAFLERMRGLGFPELLNRFESGQLGTEEFSRTLCGLAGLTLSTEEFVSAWTDIFWLNEPIAHLVSGLKRAGYTLLLGSNTNDLHATHFRRQFAETLVHFDRLVLSYEIGHIKPSAEFYRACVSAAGSVPENCVFIDDMIENVAGARAAGLNGIHYRDVVSLRDELTAHGVELPALDDASARSGANNPRLPS